MDTKQKCLAQFFLLEVTDFQQKNCKLGYAKTCNNRAGVRKGRLAETGFSNNFIMSKKIIIWSIFCLTLGGCFFKIPKRLDMTEEKKYKRINVQFCEHKLFEIIYLGCFDMKNLNQIQLPILKTNIFSHIRFDLINKDNDSLRLENIGQGGNHYSLAMAYSKKIINIGHFDTLQIDIDYKPRNVDGVISTELCFNFSTPSHKNFRQFIRLLQPAMNN